MRKPECRQTLRGQNQTKVDKKTKHKNKTKQARTEQQTQIYKETNACRHLPEFTKFYCVRMIKAQEPEKE